jgi:hypothetical protein
VKPTKAQQHQTGMVDHGLCESHWESYGTLLALRGFPTEPVDA